MEEEDPREGALLDDRYRIVERLATGGMGAVYRATQIALDRAVAVKFLHGWMATDVRARRRFEVEAQAMAKLRHPHCAQVLDFGLDGDTPYLVMELVEGETLGALLDRGPLAPPRAVAVAQQALSALAHAHDQGITHRDIKPDNLMIGEATAMGDHVRILDFGIARLAEDGGALTAGMAIGTPKYMAPEQAGGQGLDHRADLYAMAVVLFEMLAGRPPFTAAETVDVLRMHREAPPPRVAATTPRVSISGELEALLSRALAKSPDARFQDAVAFAEALRSCPEAAPAGAQAPSPPPPALPSPPAASLRLPAWARGRRGAGIAGAAALGLITLLAALADDPDSEAATRSTAPNAEAAARAAGLPAASLARARELVDGDSRRAISHLEDLSKRHGEVAEVWFLLGRAYFARMWWTDGLGAFARAIELDEGYQSDPVLIDTLLEGFVSPRAHQRIADFLHEKVGPAAIPHLEVLVAETERRRVRERARAAIDRYE